MENKFCSNCGKQLEEGLTICEDCAIEINQQQQQPKKESEFQQQVYNTQTNYNRPNYQHSNYQQPYGGFDTEKPISVGQYMGIILLRFVPIVGLILYIIWAFSSDININKRNLCRAFLLLPLILIAVYIIIVIIITAILTASRII